MNKQKIIKLFPKSLIEVHSQFFDEAFAFAEVNSPLRINMYLAQVAHECAMFRQMEENLNYSAIGLAKTWKYRYAKNPEAKILLPNELAMRISRNPVEIANHTYAGRNGNGDYESGDGWRYRGMGEMMTTGRANFTALDKAFNMNGKIIANPEMLLDPYWAVMSAAFYWKKNRLNRFADMGVKGIKPCRKVINGGLIGLDKVIPLYHKITPAL